MYVDGREVGDRSVGAREVPCREHRSERDYRGARASGRGNTRRRVFEHDTCRGVESEAFRSESITIGRRLSLRDVLAGHQNRRYRQADRGESQLRQCPSTGSHDSPTARREGVQKLPRTRHCAEASDVRELRGVEPRHLPVRLEVGSRSLHGVARSAAMRNPQDLLGIELVTQSPAAARPLDDGPGIDEDAVQIKQEPRTADLHRP